MYDRNGCCGTSVDDEAKSNRCRVALVDCHAVVIDGPSGSRSILAGVVMISTRTERALIGRPYNLNDNRIMKRKRMSDKDGMQSLNENSVYLPQVCFIDL